MEKEGGLHIYGPLGRNNKFLLTTSFCFPEHNWADLNLSSSSSFFIFKKNLNRKIGNRKILIYIYIYRVQDFGGGDGGWGT